MSRRMIVAFALGAIMILGFSTQTYATDQFGQNSLQASQAGINELLHRYEDRDSLAPARSKCQAYSDWQNFASANATLTQARTIYNMSTVQGISLSGRLPEDLKQSALSADSLYDGLQLIKASQIYNIDSDVKSMVDAKLAEISVFMANIDSVKADALTLKQELIRNFPESTAELSQLEYNTPLGSNFHPASPCVALSNLKHYLNLGNIELTNLDDPAYIFGYNPYYANFASWLLTFDDTVLRDISLPLNNQMQAFWDTIHQARALRHYDLFYRYFTTEITQVEFLQNFYPEIDFVSLVPDPSTSNYSELEQAYYEKLHELEQRVLNYEQYARLIPLVRQIEQMSDGMRYTSGAALLSNNPSDPVKALRTQIAEIITTIQDNETETPPAQSDLPTAPDTGSKATELPSVIEKTIIIAVAGLTAIVGLSVVVKLYIYSPLKRRK